MATRRTIDERLKEAEERVKQIRELKRKQEARERAAEKKRLRAEETNLKIRLGGLVVLAELGDADKGFILGVLMEAAKQKEDQSFYAKHKALGDGLLARQAAENKHSAAAQTQG